jgi:hypothetical protein
MKKLVGSLIVLLLAANAMGQGWEWARHNNGPGGADGWLVKTDNNNNVYGVTIWQADSISYGPNTYYNNGPNNYQTAIVKYDSAGNYLWSDASSKGQSYALSLTTDNQGNAYFFGMFYTDSIQFGSHLLLNSHKDSAYYQNSYYCGCFFIIKYSPTGNIIWAKTGDNVVGAYGSGAAIATDASGNVYITATYINALMQLGPDTLHNSQYGNYEMFVAKYDSSGDVVWAKSYGGPLREYGVAIAVSPKYDLYVSGGFSSATISFDSVTLTHYSSLPNESYVDFFLTKFDSSGHTIWAKSSVGSAVPNNMIFDDANNILAGGVLFDTLFVAFGNDTLDLTDSLHRIGDFIVKYDSLGNVMKLKELYTLGTYGSSTILYGMAADRCGNTWISGKMEIDTFGIRLDPNTVLKAPPNSYDPMFFAGLDSDFNVVQSLAMVSGGDDYSSLSADDAGNIYLCEDTWRNLVFGNDTVKGAGGERMYVAKYRPYLCSPQPNIVKYTPDIKSLTLYPNPATNTLTIQYPNPANGGTTANIYDITGRLMGSYPLTGNSTTISVQNLSPGIYQCRITDASGYIATKKVIIMK